MIERNDFGEVTRLTMGKLVDGKPIFTMSCYWVDGLLIDSGPFNVSEEIEEAFADLPVQMIVNTHHHEDHTGNNSIFQDKLGTGPVLAHPLAVPLIMDPDQWASSLLPYQQMVWGYPQPSLAVPIGREVRTDHYSFRVIDTPGHSDDHIALLEPRNGWLFTGDLFIKEDLTTLRWDEDVNQMLRSLNELMKYPFDTIFCSSGRVVENAREAVRSKIAYWEVIGEKVRRFNEDGLDLEQIRDLVLGRESALYVPTEGAFGKINLVRSFLGLHNRTLNK